MADGARVDRRGEGDVGLVLGRFAARHQQQPGLQEAQHHRRAAVLSIQLGPQHVAVERPGPLQVPYDQQVREGHPSVGKSVLIKRPLCWLPSTAGVYVDSVQAPDGPPRSSRCS
jgi:hypothetical protein